ncbi:hypothetical protein [Thermodesulfatator autotrophicus]|uniref:hypothetical protein n=1 Tax=Thermodesulfatator autotrophicus TaxID=1795632 RepID=UPI0018D3649F|nr:hypothetical protein [Thermodesulfatator autotrophicus]
MTKEEAERVLNILKQADGGCVYCAKELFKLFVKEFPEFKQLSKKVFIKEFEEELEK